MTSETGEGVHIWKELYQKGRYAFGAMDASYPAARNVQTSSVLGVTIVNDSS